MKLLLLADCHLDAAFRWAGPTLGRARRLAVREAFRRALALADAARVDAVLLAGDIYEQERFTQDTASFLVDALGALGRPVFIAPGNHDWYGPRSLYHQADWPGNVTLFTEPRLVPVTLTDGLTLWGGAHCGPVRTPGFLDGFAVDRGGIHLALFHGSERGGLAQQGSAKLAHAPFRAGQVPAAGLQHALCGHFHHPRDDAWVTYPGNPEPLAFGETGERGAVILTVDGTGALVRERHRIATTTVCDVTVDVTGARHTAELRDRVEAATTSRSGIVRVTLVGETRADLGLTQADLIGVAPHLDALVPRLGDLRVGYDVAALAGESGVRAEFVRAVLGADLAAEDCRRVLLTGLRALDGRDDDLEVA